MIVKGTTKSGIKFQMDSKVKDDTRLLFLMIMELLSFIFGSDENCFAFMNEVAAVHKGVCLPKDLISELQEMFEALNAKN